MTPGYRWMSGLLGSNGMRDFVTRLAAQTFLSSIYHLLLLTVRDTITLAMKHNVATFDAYVEEHGRRPKTHE